MDPFKMSELLGVPVDTAATAMRNIKTREASWILVSGKMCSGKDSVAPLLQPRLGYELIERVSYSDFMRVEANQAIKILTGRTEPESVLSDEIAGQLLLEKIHAQQLVSMLAPSVRKPDHGIVAQQRTDLIRDILILFGTDWRTDADPTYWSRRAAAKSIKLLSEGVSVFLTGGRFLPDVELPQDVGATIVRLDITEETQKQRLAARDGLTPPPETLNHISETALDDWPRYDVRVDNNGTLEEGVELVVSKLKELSL